jgi:hypothetical protein
MMDFTAALQFATLPLAVRLTGVPIQMPWKHGRLFQNSLEQRLTFRPREPRNRIRTRPSGTNSEDAAVAITARVSSLAIIERKDRSDRH